jgi:hypothetical protein
MTAPTLWYVPGLKSLVNAGLGIASVTGTIKMMFLSSAYVFDQDAHDFLSDVNANEVTGTGVAAGGVTLSSVTVTVDGSTNTVSIDAADITGISVSACYGVIHVSTGTATTSPLYLIVDFSEGTATNVTITGVTWNASGIAALTAA